VLIKRSAKEKARHHLAMATIQDRAWGSLAALLNGAAQ
jgi:hypothetical protein